MADKETEQNQEQSTETETKEENITLSRNELNAMINAAVSSHVKRLEKKIPKEVPKEEASNEEKGEEKDATSKQIEALTRKIKEMEKREKLAEEKARRANLHNEISTLLKGKVSEDWQDVAIEKISGLVKFEDNKAVVEVDDLPYSVSEFINDKWLTDSNNKRFLAAPKSVVQKQKVVAPTYKPSNGQVKSKHDLLVEAMAEIEALKQ